LNPSVDQQHRAGFLSSEAERARVTQLANPEGKLGLLRGREHWDRRRRARHRNELVDRLLEAARSSPFWAERISPGSRLKDLPLLDRETVREEFERIRTVPDHAVVTLISSGSSGRPVRAELGPEQIGFGAAARLRQLEWFGLPSVPVAKANIQGHGGDTALDVTSTDPPQYEIDPWRLDRRILPAVHARIVEAGGVRLIGANTSMFVLLAELYRESGCDARELGCDLGIVGSELTDPAQRRTIEEVFGCRTAEMYGATEAPVIAIECPDGSLHVNEDAFQLEVLRPDGRPAPPGELGSVAVTLLHNVEFPLLRYCLGDAACVVEEECPCGRRLMRLDIALGHLEEMVAKRDRSLVHPHFIRNAYHEVLGTRLRAFHTDQEAPGIFNAYLDTEADLADCEARLEARFEAVLGEPVSLTVRRDPERARRRLPNGKLRMFSRRV
jgi:phenylacetate-CoA ligase